MASRRRKRKGNWLEKYVENNYRKAGYDTQRHVIVKDGEIDVLAVKRNKKFAVEVKSGKQNITSSVIEKTYRKAASIGAKPVLVVTSSKLTQPARRTAKKLGVRIRRIKRRQ